MKIITETIRKIILQTIEEDILAEMITEYINDNLDYEELAAEIVEAYGGVQELAKNAILEDLPF